MSRDAVYLKHILDAIERIESYTRIGKDTFMKEPHWQDAVIRQLEIVGEATKRLSADLRSDHPEIPWKRVAGLRDVLIHDYMGVDLGAVWIVTQVNLPELKKTVQSILKDS